MFKLIECDYVMIHDVFRTNEINQCLKVGVGVSCVVPGV